MNGVLVKMSNGDNETFKTATAYKADYDGVLVEHGKWLRVFQGELMLGEFPPGSWTGVRYFEGYTPPTGPVIDGEGLGKTYRRNPLGGITVTTNPNPGTYTINATTSRVDPGDDPPAAVGIPA